jgi:hypothetical protein
LENKITYGANGIFSFFLHFSFLFFEKTAKNLQNYTSGAAGDGGRDLPPCPTAVAGAVSLFSKICNLFV